MTTLLSSLTRSAAGQDQSAYLQTFPPFHPSGGNATVTASTLYIVAIGRLARPVTIAGFKLSIAVAAGNLDVALLQQNGDGSYTRLASTGSQAVGGTGIQSFALAATAVAPAGVDLALAAAPDTATLSWFRLQGGSATNASISQQVQSKASVGIPIPASIASPSAGLVLPYIWAG